MLHLSRILTLVCCSVWALYYRERLLTPCTTPFDIFAQSLDSPDSDRKCSKVHDEFQPRLGFAFCFCIRMPTHGTNLALGRKLRKLGGNELVQVTANSQTRRREYVRPISLYKSFSFNPATFHTTFPPTLPRLEFFRSYLRTFL